MHITVKVETTDNVTALSAIFRCHIQCAHRSQALSLPLLSQCYAKFSLSQRCAHLCLTAVGLLQCSGDGDGGYGDDDHGGDCDSSYDNACDGSDVGNKNGNGNGDDDGGGDGDVIMKKVVMATVMVVRVIVMVMMMMAIVMVVMVMVVITLVMVMMLMVIVMRTIMIITSTFTEKRVVNLQVYCDLFTFFCFQFFFWCIFI